MNIFQFCSVPKAVGIPHSTLRAYLSSLQNKPNIVNPVGGGGFKYSCKIGELISSLFKVYSKVGLSRDWNRNKDYNVKVYNEKNKNKMKLLCLNTYKNIVVSGMISLEKIGCLHLCLDIILILRKYSRMLSFYYNFQFISHLWILWLAWEGTYCIKYNR